MEQSKKEHHHQQGRNDYFASTHLVDHPVELRPEGQYVLGVAHAVVEEGHQGRERVGNRIGATVKV